MESLSAMFKTGLYINDLSMHDSSRDLVLAGTQQSEELKRALIQVRHAPKSCSMFSPSDRLACPFVFSRTSFHCVALRPVSSLRMSQIALRGKTLSLLSAGAKEVQ